MALPNLQYRKDLIVMASWDEVTPLEYKNWCGATGISLSLTNNVNETTVADCDDWSLPAQIIRAYGAQSVTATVNASLTRAGRDKLIRAVWASVNFRCVSIWSARRRGKSNTLMASGFFRNSASTISAVQKKTPSSPIR